MVTVPAKGIKENKPVPDHRRHKNTATSGGINAMLNGNAKCESSPR